METGIVGVLAFVLAAGSSAGGTRPAAEEWVRVAAHGDGGSVEVDRRSITLHGGLRAAWWRIALAAPRSDGTAMERHHILVDCREGLTVTLALVSIDAHGGVIGDAREPEGAALRRLSPATPGTTGEAAAKAICAMEPPRRPTRAGPRARR